MMTATIVTDHTRVPVNPKAKLYRSRRCDADLTRCALDPHIPGQLWERVAETPSNAPAPLTARQDEAIVRAYADRDIRERGGRGHSPAVCTDCPSASGIIRAGERIK